MLSNFTLIHFRKEPVLRKFTKAALASAAIVGTIAGGSGIASAATPVMQQDGVYRVGIDVEPGTYQSGATLPNYPCKWARYGATPSGLPTLLDYGVTISSVTLKIGRGDFGFATQNCGGWTKIGGAGTGSLGSSDSLGSLGSLGLAFGS